MKKIKEKIKERVEKFIDDNSQALIVLVCTILTCGMLVSCGLIIKHYLYTPDTFSYLTNIETLKHTYTEFKDKTTDKEKFIRFVDLFYQKQYSQTRNWGKYDCSSALITYYNSFGANLIDENVLQLKQRIEKLQYLNLITLRKNYYEVKLWDIIIFKQTASDYHIGIVCDKPNGNIEYLDMNNIINTMGVNVIKYNDTKIIMISDVSFALWAGDLLK